MRLKYVWAATSVQKSVLTMTTFKLGLVIFACLVCANTYVRAQTPICFNFRNPIEKAQCLLKSDRNPVVLPRNFKSLLSESVYESDLISWRDDSGVRLHFEYVRRMRGGGHIGGPLKDRIPAQYFVIHSVTPGSSSTISEEESDLRILHQHEVRAERGRINLNALHESGLFHVYAFRDGRSVTVADFIDVRRTSNLVTSGIDPRLFTHVGVEVPSSNSPSNILSFTEAQAQTLALVYVVASIRAERWLIPAFHSSLEPTFKHYQIEPNSLWLWDYEIGQLIQLLDSTSFKKYEAEYVRYLGIAERKVGEIKGQLKLIRRPLPNGSAIEGYNANDVKQVFARNKTELLEGLNNEEFAGIRAYINRYYPSPESLPTFQVNTKSGSYPSELTYTRVSNPTTVIQDPIILVTTVDNSLKTIRAILSTLYKNKEAIDFEVTSVPSGATVTLKADGGKSRTADTNSRITNFFRGIYTYSITKEGFKTISREINLMHERGTRLECTFAINSCVIR